MQRSNVWLATALLDDPVRNSAGENLGRVEDVVIDPDTGNIRYAVVSFAGIPGTGNRLFAIPWSSINVSPARDYVVMDINKDRLERAPAFDRDHWPDMADPIWRRQIDDYYGGVPSALPPVRERRVYVERPAARHRGLSVFAGILLVCVVLALGWMTFLVSTRGWDQAREDIKSSLQNAAYAAKETSHEAALTTRVKTALALSKRIPAGQISVDSEGDVVTLRGEVPSNQTRELAESIAADVPGVREVHNHLYAITQSH